MSGDALAALPYLEHLSCEGRVIEMPRVEFRAFPGVFGRDFSESVVLFALSVFGCGSPMSVCLSVCVRALLCVWDGVCVIPG